MLSAELSFYVAARAPSDPRTARQRAVRGGPCDKALTPGPFAGHNHSSALRGGLVAANIPKLRLIVGGTVIEGTQVTLTDLPRAEQGGASELVGFLGGAKRVLILQRPVVYGSAEAVQPRYLVIRQDQIQACEFIIPDVLETEDQIRDSFRWEWDE